MLRRGHQCQALGVQAQEFVVVRVLAAAGSGDGQVQAAFVEQLQQARADVLDDLHGNVRLHLPQAGECAQHQRHRAGDGADRQVAAMALQDALHFLMQVRQIRVDEPRITDHAAAQIIGLQALRRTGEQRRTEGRLDFV